MRRAIKGTRSHAEALRDEIAGALAVMGLRLSPDKTLTTHIDEGVDFLGWRIQRHRKRGTNRYYIYTYGVDSDSEETPVRLSAADGRPTRYGVAPGGGYS